MHPEESLKTVGLSLDQAPQLSIPASFFLTIPIGVLLAAYILLKTGTAALVSPWMPQALALTHAGTLGVLAMGMIGALYQMTPVVAGSPVPFTRLAHLVHMLLLSGLVAFVWRLLGGRTHPKLWCYASSLRLRSMDILRDEIDMHKANGFKAMKIKIGKDPLASGYLLENRCRFLVRAGRRCRQAKFFQEGVQGFMNVSHHTFKV